MKISENFSLQTYNTFGFEITTRYWATFRTPDELREIVSHCRQNSIPWYVLGGGSNSLFRGDYPGMVIHPTGSEIVLDHEQGVIVAEAGVVWDDLVAWTVAKGWGGLENLSLIPGSVGAAPVQNVGAYGVEVGERVKWVEYLDTDNLQIIRISGDDCHFGYRDSIFKQTLTRAIVLRVGFRLVRDPREFNVGYGDLHREVESRGGATLENIREAVIYIRKSKLPDPQQIGNCGSFFKNPVLVENMARKLIDQFPDMPHYPLPECGAVKIPAGWLIEQAGWRGFRRGDAGVHRSQALVLVNHSGATPSEIIDLAREITSDVEQKFGVALEMEVGIVDKSIKVGSKIIISKTFTLTMEKTKKL